MTTLKLLLADDHRLVLEGVRRALAGSDDFEIVGEATSGDQVLPLVHQLDPDLLLLDLRMPRMDGLTCLDLLRKRAPRTKVVVLSVYHDSEHVHNALSRGACGYIVKSIAPTDLPAALRQTAQQTIHSAFGAPNDDNVGSGAGLSRRETTILKLVAAGRSNREIAAELWVTEQTVKFHLTNIYRKIDVANRTEAARFAFRAGIAQNPAIDEEPLEVRRGG
jgi:DNA-binding NarL/FixJ family response regulator